MKTEVCLYSRRVTQKLTLLLVGTIGNNTDPPADMQSDGPPDATLPVTPLLIDIPNEIEHEATNETGPLEPQPPSLSEYPSPSLCSYSWEAAADTGGSISDYTSFTSAVEELLSSTSISHHGHDPYDGEIFPDSGGMPLLHPVMPAAPPIPPVTTPDAHTIIPQSPYVCGRQQRFQRSESITFSTNGFAGMNMRDALCKRFTSLDGRDDLVLQGAGSSISCRLQVC